MENFVLIKKNSETNYICMNKFNQIIDNLWNN